MTEAIQPAEQDITAALNGLRLAFTAKRWWGVKPSGKAGQNVQAEQIICTGKDTAAHARDLAAAITRAQTRWPEATAWELIGADTNRWQGIETFAAFNWPLRNAQ